MARKEKKQEDLNFGDDSFMDIVANLVGVLIILIILVGVQAGLAPIDIEEIIVELETKDQKAEPIKPIVADLVKDPAPTPEPEVLPEETDEQSELLSKFNQSMNEVMMIQQTMTEQGGNILEMKYTADKREKERNEISLILAASEAVINERANKLDDTARKNFQSKREVEKLELELVKTDNDLAAWELQPKVDIVKIKHFPPITKSVTDKEVHFQLKNGKITELPYKQFIRTLGNTLRSEVRSIERLGEIRTNLKLGGWTVRYQLSRDGGTLEERYYARSGITFKAEFELVNGALAETLTQAGQANSRFMQRLKYINPLRETITLWVYPDSFDEYRKLQKWLYPQGLRIAGRPLRMDQKITFSTAGTQSNAQ